MKTINAHLGQTLTDIAIQEYGCEEAVFILMDDNPALNMNGQLIARQPIEIRDSVPQLTENNKAIATEMQARQYYANTGTGATQDNTYVDDTYVDLTYTI